MTGNRDDSLDERRKRLADELAKVKAEDEAEVRAETNAAENRKGFAMADKLSSEFISAIVVRSTGAVAKPPLLEKADRQDEGGKGGL